MINKNIYKSSLYYLQYASHKFLSKSMPNLIFYQNPSLILSFINYLQAFRIDSSYMILSDVDLI